MATIFTKMILGIGLVLICWANCLANASEKSSEKKISFRELADYYRQVSDGAIEENPIEAPLFDLDLNLIPRLSRKDIEFRVNMNKKAAHPLRLLSPDSVSQFFVLKPQVYIRQALAKDFLDAKRKVYEKKEFNAKTLRYARDFVHLEDWRSLNHPPVKNLGDDLTIWDQDYAPVDYQKKESIFYNVDFQKNLDLISGTELTFGNRSKLLANGESFRRKIEEINNAKKSVLMAVMSFYCDDSSRVLEDLLIRKVKEGVDVKLMVEKVWTKLLMKKCMHRMVKGGVDVVYANDLLKKGEESALFHNKFVVIDHAKVIIGGSNIVSSDNLATGYNHLNRDNDVFLEGPIATDAMFNFILLWKKYSREKNELNQGKNPNVKDISVYEKIALEQKGKEKKAGVRGSEYYSTVFNHPRARNQGVCRFVTQNPDTDKHKLTKVFIEYISHAQERMNLTTGSIYFDLPNHDEKERVRDTYNKKLFRSIFSATERGVKLDLIGNGIDGGYGEVSNMFNRLKLENRFKFKPIQKGLFSMITHGLDHGAAKKNQPYLEYVERMPNARAWSNFQYMHSKLMQIDRVVNLVSSYNLEEWSGDKSHETAIVCLDESLSKEMDKSFLKDFVNSVPVSY